MGPFTNWKGISPRHTLSRNNDNFFDRSFRSAWDSSSGIRDEELTVPAINVEEDDNSFMLRFAAPGYEKSDFAIHVKDRTLTISASREDNHSEGKNKEKSSRRFARREFFYHSFSRSFTLPENVKEDDISAQYKNGILSVEVPIDKDLDLKQSTKKILIG